MCIACEEKVAARMMNKTKIYKFLRLHAKDLQHLQDKKVKSEFHRKFTAGKDIVQH